MKDERHVLIVSNACVHICEYMHKCICIYVDSVFVGPCHHDMARPQVADGGTSSDMEGSCE